MITDLAGGVIGAGLWVAQSARAGRVVALPPMLAHSDKRFQNVTASPEYAPGLKADIWSLRDVPEEGRPVFLYVPGGAWVLGKRRPQGYALMSHLVKKGWLCVAIEYRTAPTHQWPTPYSDVERAYRWVRTNIAAYGGDPSLVVMGGASAGAHMAALGGLQWQNPPEAVVGIYGPYNWEKRRSLFMSFLESVVVGGSRERFPETYRAASPLAQVHRDAPPFLLIHGTADRLCPIGDARRFNEALREVSQSSALMEFQGAGHGFDLTDPSRTKTMVDAIADFVGSIYASRREEKAS